MLCAAAESLTARLEELKAFFPAHYAELAEDREFVPLDPDYPEYLRRDAAGMVLFVALREDGRIVGYVVSFIAKGLHYQSTLTMHTDIFYILKEHRRGLAGPLQMFRVVQREARRRGVRRWYAGEKIAHQVGPLFRRLGMRPVETMWSMMLEPEDAPA